MFKYRFLSGNKKVNKFLFRWPEYTIYRTLTDRSRLSNLYLRNRLYW